MGLEIGEDAWHMQLALNDGLAEAWQKPYEGIWEVRGPRREFTHFKLWPESPFFA